MNECTECSAPIPMGRVRQTGNKEAILCSKCAKEAQVKRLVRFDMHYIHTVGFVSEEAARNFQWEGLTRYGTIREDEGCIFVCTYVSGRGLWWKEIEALLASPGVDYTEEDREAVQYVEEVAATEKMAGMERLQKQLFREGFYKTLEVVGNNLKALNAFSLLTEYNQHLSGADPESIVAALSVLR